MTADVWALWIAAVLAVWCVVSLVVGLVLGRWLRRHRETRTTEPPAGVES